MCSRAVENQHLGGVQLSGQRCETDNGCASGSAGVVCLQHKLIDSWHEYDHCMLESGFDDACWNDELESGEEEYFLLECKRILKYIKKRKVSTTRQFKFRPSATDFDDCPQLDLESLKNSYCDWPQLVFDYNNMKIQSADFIESDLTFKERTAPVSKDFTVVDMILSCRSWTSMSDSKISLSKSIEGNFQPTEEDSVKDKDIQMKLNFVENEQSIQVSTDSGYGNSLSSESDCPGSESVLLSTKSRYDTLDEYKMLLQSGKNGTQFAKESSSLGKNTDDNLSKDTCPKIEDICVQLKHAALEHNTFLHERKVENKYPCSNYDIVLDSKNPPSGNFSTSVGSILFYIRDNSSQKTTFTFHHLQYIVDPQDNWSSCSKQYTVKYSPRRGETLLCRLQQLGLLRLHEITPTLVIVQPAQHGLGSFFQQMVNQPDVPIGESMHYEWIRLRSFWSFPRNAGVFSLQMARAGFYFTGRASETCCYSCGFIYRHWREGDNPHEIHQQYSPDCLHVHGREPRNTPIYPGVNHQWPAVLWEPMNLPREGEQRAAGAQVSDVDTEETAALGPAGDQTQARDPTQEENIAVKSSTYDTNNSTEWDAPGSPATSDTNRGRFEATATGEITEQPIETVPMHIGAARGAEGSGIQTDERGTEEKRAQDTDEHRAQQEVQPPRREPEEHPEHVPAHRSGQRGLLRADPKSNFRPRYPGNAVFDTRTETFRHGWPAHLDQTPYEMASAGFFFAGQGDHCRCFHCGGGLRNWEAGDDPWVEHARWFPQCLYVKQNKGEGFIKLVQNKQMPQEAVPADSSNPPQVPAPGRNQPQDPVMQRNQEARGQQSQGQRQGQGQQQGATRQQAVQSTGSHVDEMSLPAVESLKENGVSPSVIRQLLITWRRQQKRAVKISNVTATSLMDILFEQEEEEERRRRVAETLLPSSLAGDDTSGLSSDQAGASFSGMAPAATASEFRHSDPELSRIVALHDTNEMMKKQLICVICDEREVGVAYVPCGHLVCCSDCAPAMVNCPLCNEAITNSIKVFL